MDGWMRSMQCVRLGRKDDECQHFFPHQRRGKFHQESSLSQPSHFHSSQGVNSSGEEEEYQMRGK
ncbi:hypothetical protein F2P79_000924 [Pimephales promelas]|nr:hypothetical protein F2P79_000924 [Pimephales promelas]